MRLAALLALFSASSINAAVVHQVAQRSSLRGQYDGDGDAAQGDGYDWAAQLGSVYSGMHKKFGVDDGAQPPRNSGQGPAPDPNDDQNLLTIPLEAQLLQKKAPDSQPAVPA